MGDDGTAVPSRTDTTGASFELEGRVAATGVPSAGAAGAEGRG